MNTQTLDFKSFVRNEKYPTKELLTLLEDKNLLKVVKVGAGLMLVLIPKTAFAATKATADQTFGDIWDAVMNIVDWIVVGVLVFAGVAWMFGHRTKALELLIGGSAGYILARHAIDIRDFLKKL
ncbi:glycosyltransferase [Neobacillus sp. PS3-40]|uniref:glycosyltransferase n=1 Tax=Neobacillus sp. PS3-40 TaxID=3070679 RepID=UPI0027DF1523|nr:glycosyltransferase [Neobacillus sp. PS3-40]WML44098.1 glycosyltransferase [Neobacillus sp. PS3-40]